MRSEPNAAAKKGKRRVRGQTAVGGGCEESQHVNPFRWIFSALLWNSVGTLHAARFAADHDLSSVVNLCRSCVPPAQAAAAVISLVH